MGNGERSHITNKIPKCSTFLIDEMDQLLYSVKHCASVFNSPRYFRERLSCRAAMLSREVLCAMPASIEFEIPPDSANIGTISQLSPTFLRWSQVSKHRGDSISEVNSSNGRRVFRLQLGIARFPRALSMARRRLHARPIWKHCRPGVHKKGLSREIKLYPMCGIY